MTLLRKTLRALAILFLLLGLALLAGGYALKRQADAQGLGEVAWSGFSVESGVLRLERLDFSFAPPGQDQLHVSLRGLRLDPNLLHLSRPLESLQIAALDADWYPAANPAPSSPPVWPDAERIRRWLETMPRQVRIDALRIGTPCRTGRCPLQGSLLWERPSTPNAPASLDLRLQPPGHSLVLQARLSPGKDASELALDLLADGQPRLHSHHWLASRSGRLDWNGTLALGALPEAPWLLEWLAQWSDFDPTSLPPPPADVRLGASWSLTLPAVQTEAVAGEIRAAAHLPSPWPVPDLGLLEGDLELAMHGEAGQWLPGALQARLSLVPEARHLQALPAALRPTRLRLEATRTQAAPLPDALELDLSLAAEGPLQARLSAPAARIDANGVQLAGARLELRAKRLDLDPLRLDGLVAQLPLQASLDRQRLRLATGQNSRLGLDRLTLGGDSPLAAHAIELQLEALNAELILDTAALALNTQPRLTVERLTQAQLRPQPWQWHGRLQLDGPHLQASGRLTNRAGLQLDSEAKGRLDGRLDASARGEIAFAKANPLAATLRDWPPLLDLNDGHIHLDASARTAPRKPIQAEARLQLQDIDGIYDRTALSDLSGHLALSLNGTALRSEIGPLTLAEANPGLPLGPLHLEAAYQGQLDALGAGQLQWKDASLRLLGGEARMPAGQMRLDSRQSQPLQVRGLDIAQLLTAYPAEGLSGNGLVDGQLQLALKGHALVVESGQLAARAPGQLRLQSPGIRALGQSNPAMQLVASALEDFHYGLLRSDIRYDEKGTLRLGLRLHGSNPTLEGGRPINFNINLEEDVPALLTSLQLSGRISETIEKRLQQRLLDKDSEPATP